MDTVNFFPQLAAHLGVAPSSLMFWLWAFTIFSNSMARLIPENKDGPLKTLRYFFSITGVLISNRISGGISASDIQTAALQMPSVQNKIAAIKDVESQ